MNPPEHLSESARKAWAEIVKSMTGAVDGIEAPGLEAFAVAVGRMRDAQQRVDEEGMVVQDDKGRPVAHPALAVERTYAAEVKRWTERYRPYPSRR